MANEPAGEDSEGGHHRLRRALRHCFGIARGLKEFNPNEWDGCKELYHYLTDPKYRGDTNYPVWDRLNDRDWVLEPDDFEMERGRSEEVDPPSTP